MAPWPYLRRSEPRDLTDSAAHVMKPTSSKVSRYSGKGTVMPEEIKLIQPALVVHDENGMFWHPELPSFDEGDEQKSKQWVADQGLSVLRVSLENADEAVADRV